MRRAIKSANKAEREYQDRARELGCVVCRFRVENGMQDARQGQCGYTHLHHRNLNDQHGQKQLGQDAVVALGSWHHDARLDLGMDSEAMRDIYGPSYAATPKDFRTWTEDVLPELDGKGTARWQAQQDIYLAQQDGST